MKDKIDEIYYLVKKKNDESDNKLICILLHPCPCWRSAGRCSDCLRSLSFPDP